MEHIQWNLYNKDSTRTIINCPVYRGVLISEGLNVHMSMQRLSNGAEQWCPVKGGDCISEVSFVIEVSLYTFVNSQVSLTEEVVS